ncbi:hypothetical protein D0Z00_003166 [Geotrichum galactomycetum]|uniref:Uncharacterized protein n=1 Tax=Geotrichum galactomycetum TaxID=27317 RepID=A0ACB6V232_9ASCO|nr:hypothetical protein D0Z00_003166 [Geotrichum candidum]
MSSTRCSTDVSQTASFVTVDASLADSALTLAMLHEDIRHALYFDGFFVLQNASPSSAFSVLRTQTASFFQSTPEIKNEIRIENSPHFRGYDSRNDQLRFATEGFAPTQFEDEEDSINEPDYKWLLGPNQWPRRNRGFKRAIDTFMETMDGVAYKVVSKFMTAAIGATESLFENVYNQPTPHAQLTVLHTAHASNKPAFQKNKIGLVSFVLGLDETTTVSVLSSDGRLVDVELTPGSMLVVCEEAMQQLSKSLLKSASYSLHQAVSTNFAVFTQCLSLDFQYKNFTFPKRLLRKRADCSIYDDEMESPDEFFQAFGKSVFMEYINAYPSVTEKWYPHLLSSAATAGTENELPHKIMHLLKLQKSVDDSILLHSISSTAPITLHQLTYRVSENSRLTLDLAFVQQILTIWPEAYIVEPSVVNPRELTLSIPRADESLVQSLPKRQARFDKKCVAYAKAHGNCSNIPLYPVADTSKCSASPVHPATPTKRTPPRITKQPSPYGRTPMSVLSSASSRLNSLSLTSPAKKLALGSPAKKPLSSLATSPVKKTGTFLERIRAKEQAAKLAAATANPLDTPEAKYERYLESKLLAIAPIVAGLRPGTGGDRKPTTMALSQVLGKIRDSLKLALSPRESEDCLRLLAQRVPELCELRTVSGVTGVCILGGLSVGEIRSRLIETAA